MPRESNIPLFLWVAAAVLVHLSWKDGADRASQVIEERMDLQRFAQTVRMYAQGEGQTFEVSFVEEPEAKPPEAPDTEQGESEEAKDEEPDEPEPEETIEPKPKRNEKPVKPVEPPQLPPEEQKKPEEQKPDEKKTDEKKPAEEKPAEPLPPVAVQNRIAVRQQLEDKNQKDNPSAEFIADEANHVKEQTQARITSTTQNDANPTPGSSFSGPRPEPGNSDESRVAQDEDSPGVANHAPNERTGETEGQVAAAVPPAAQGSPSPEDDPGKESAGTKAAPTPADTRPGQSAQEAQAALRGAQAAPDLVSSESGTEAVAEAQAAQRARKAKKARKKRLPPPKSSGGYGDLLGFGSPGTSRSGINLNLTPSAAVAAIGRDVLVKERRADAERRRSAHLGSWRNSGIERWRAAIENYVPSVKPGNQTALNTARVPFASYLNVIHNRLHPIFADSFLGSLGNLPASHPMNQEDLRTNLEIVLSQDDGRVVRMGITRTSGVTAFDIAALESVQRASPFGPPPREIVSPDGNVYFHWEFYRNPYYACSTYFARPYLLKVQPKTAPPSVPTPAPTNPTEDSAPQRHGRAPDAKVEPFAELR